jgi:hypothetical protein
MTRRFLLPVALLLPAAGQLLVPAAAAADPGQGSAGACGIDSCITGAAGPGSYNVYRHGPSDPVDGRGDVGQGYATGKTTWLEVEEDAAPTCSGNGRGTGDALCGAAVNTCPTGEVRFWIWHRTIRYTLKPDGSKTQEVVADWHQEPKTYCLGADDPKAPTIAQVVDKVQSDFATLPLRRDDVASDPGPTTVVNIDTAFHAGSAQPQTFDPVLLGTPVHVTATPSKWHWTWGDGTTSVTTTPGVPHKPVVSHRYTRVADVTVSVSVEWTGSFTIGSDPTSYAITTPAFTPAQTVAVRVRQARSELVSQ